MAGNSGPDLSTAVDAVEALMDDRCRITRDQRVKPKLDTKTGSVVDAVPSVLVEDHPCSVKFSGGYPQRGDGESDVVDADYVLSFPLYTTPELKVGDIVEVTDTRRDPELVGRKFKLEAPYRKTFAVSRKWSANSLEPA